MILLTIAIVVTLIIINNRNKQYDATHTGQKGSQKLSGAVDMASLEDGERQLKERHERNANSSTNVLLYVGSSLVVGSLLYLINTVDGSLVAPVFIFVTIAIYFAGLLLAKAVPYLKPVGKAFNYSSLVLMLFWIISFNDIFDNLTIATILTAFSCLIAYCFSAIKLESKVIGTICYFLLLTFLLSVIPDNLSHAANAYCIYVAIFAVIAFAQSLWLSKPNWLPVCFRYGSKLMVDIIPVAVGFMLFLFWIIPNSAIIYPFIRSFTAFAFAVVYIWRWACEHKKSQLIIIRFLGAQVLVLSIFADCVNYSLLLNSDEVSTLIMTVAWGALCCLQAIFALFARRDTNEDKRAEDTAGIIALCGLFLTLLFGSTLTGVAESILDISIAACLGCLGIFYAIKKNQIPWLYATLGASILIPIIVCEQIIQHDVSDVAYMILYGIIGMIWIIAYTFLRDINKTRAYSLILVSNILFCVFILFSSLSFGTPWAGFLIMSILSICFAWLSGQAWLYEATIYLFSMTLCCIVSDFFQSAMDNTEVSAFINIGADRTLTEHNSLLSAVNDFVNAHVIGLTLLGTSYWFERKQKTHKIRFILAYSLFSFAAIWASLLAINKGENISIAVFFLAEQIACLIYAAIKQIGWMTGTSIVLSAILTLGITGGYHYGFVWLLVFGFAIIGFVIWRLTSLNAAKEPAENKIEYQPRIAVAAPKKKESGETKVKKEELKPSKMEDLYGAIDDEVALKGEKKADKKEVDIEYDLDHHTD